MDSTSVQNGATPVLKWGSTSVQFSVHNYPFPFWSFSVGKTITAHRG